MSTSIPPSRVANAELDEFALPMRAEQLVGRIEIEFSEPCRVGIHNLTQQHDQALAEAQSALRYADQQRRDEHTSSDKTLKRAQDQLSKERDHFAETFEKVKETVIQHRGGLDQSLQVAETHLKQTGTHARRLMPVISTTGTMREATSTIDAIEKLLNTIKGITKPGFWPSTTWGKWLLGITALICLFKFMPLLLVYPLLIVTRRWRTAVRLETLFDEVQIQIARARVCLINHLVAEEKQCLAATEAAEGHFHEAELEHQRARAKAEDAYRKAEVRFRAATEKADAARRQGTSALHQRYAPVALRLHEDIHAFRILTSFAGLDWEDPKWEQWTLDPSMGFAARIGHFRPDLRDLKSHFPNMNLDFDVPCMVPFAREGTLLLRASGEHKAAAIQAVQSVMLRVLASTPAGMLRLMLIDPVGLGQNVASFLDLKDHDKALITGKPWTEPQHIEQKLAELSEHIEEVIQSHLRNKYATLHEFNLANSAVPEAFRFLLVFDFPANFTDASAKRLLSIIKNGPRCGVFTILVWDPSYKPLYQFQMDDMKAASSLIDWVSDSRYPVWRHPFLGDCAVETDRTPGAERFAQITHRAGELAVDAMKIEVPFDALLQMDELNENRWWSRSTLDRIDVALGPRGANQLQRLVLGQGTAIHSVVVGSTGSGKSNLLHIIITGLALAYPPDEIRLYLIDFKDGVEFKRYATHNLPHADVIAIRSDREFGLSVLRGLNKEMERRGELLRNDGVSDLPSYRGKHPDEVLPRLFLLVDEFHVFFATHDALADEARSILDHLARQGRSFGIHIMLASQSLSKSSMVGLGAMLGQIGVRIALRCTKEDSEAILAHDNYATRQLSRSGQAVYNDGAGLVEANSLFQVAYFPREDAADDYLERLNRLARSRHRSHRPVVFEGNAPAVLAESQALRDACPASDRQAAAPTVWLGEPVAMEPPVGAEFKRRAGRNLLVVTRDELQGQGVLMAAWLSLIAQHHEAAARYLVLNATTEASAITCFESVARCVDSGRVQILTERGLSEMLKGLRDEVQSRFDRNLLGEPPVYLIINGLQRARDLRNAEDFRPMSSLSDVPSAAELFAYILREGPETGVHTLVWCDGWSAVKRALRRQALEAFGLRVGGAMSQEESRDMLDTLEPSRLDKPHRVFFRDDYNPSVIKKFRPYGLPDSGWIEQYLKERC